MHNNSRPLKGKILVYSASLPGRSSPSTVPVMAGPKFWKTSAAVMVTSSTSVPDEPATSRSMIIKMPDPPLS